MQAAGQDGVTLAIALAAPWPRTLAWCRSTPYMESFLAFSRKWISASPGVIPLQGDREGDTWPGAPPGVGQLPGAFLAISPSSPGAHR